MLMRREGMSVRAVAGTLNRSPSSISRELSRHSAEGTLYDASIAGAKARERRHQRRRLPKLGVHTVLLGLLSTSFGRAGLWSKSLAHSRITILNMLSSGCHTKRSTTPFTSSLSLSFILSSWVATGISTASSPPSARWKTV